MPVEKQILTAVIVAAIFAAGFAVYWVLGVLEEDKLRKTGKPLLAAIVQAHNDLYARGPKDRAAIVLITFETDIPDLANYLHGLATRALELTRTIRVGVDSHADVDAALAVMDTRYQPGKRTLLPSEFTGGRQVYSAYVMVRRQYLPSGKLTDPFLACKALPGARGRLVMIDRAELKRGQ
jgi:hypothetical protein